MTQPPSAAVARRLFRPLEQTDFLRLPHAPYLKGLLRPFKGKGDLIAWATHSAALRDSLIRLAQRTVADATVYPFSLLPITLSLQPTSAGTTFLRWRNADRSAMGVSLWGSVIDDPNTPNSMCADLYAIELQRVLLNMQISLTHTIARLAQECAEKMAQSDSIFQRRVDRDAQHQESL